MVLTKEQVSKIEDIAARYGLSLVILFGSQARGTAVAESDTDIAIKGTKEFSLDDRIDIAIQFDAVFSEVEVVDIRQASPLLLAAIARHGQPLFELESTLFQEFQLYAFNQYFDFKPVLDRLKERNKAALKEL